MTIQEYIDAVAERLDLPERVITRIRRDLENELFELVQAGADQQQAIEKMGPVEELAAKLNEKYADTRPQPKSEQGEMPLLLPWRQPKERCVTQSSPRKMPCCLLSVR